MHPYATDSSERFYVPLILATSAILAAWLLPKLLQSLGVSLPWWVDAPAVMAFYGIFHAAFDRWIWRWSPVRRMGLVKVPNIRGDWRYAITSSHGTSVIAAVSIQQNWRGMRVRLETDQSRSMSLIASLLTGDPDEYVLSYEYNNTPKPNAMPTMHAHRGSAEVRFPRTDWVTAGSGEYYSGRDRMNQGGISAERR